eukprot:RCo040265
MSKGNSQWSLAKSSSSSWGLFLRPSLFQSLRPVKVPVSLQESFDPYRSVLLRGGRDYPPSPEPRGATSSRSGCAALGGPAQHPTHDVTSEVGVPVLVVLDEVNQSTVQRGLHIEVREVFRDLRLQGLLFGAADDSFCGLFELTLGVVHLVKEEHLRVLTLCGVQGDGLNGHVTISPQLHRGFHEHHALPQLVKHPHQGLLEVPDLFKFVLVQVRGCRLVVHRDDKAVPVLQCTPSRNGKIHLCGDGYHEALVCRAAVEAQSTILPQPLSVHALEVHHLSRGRLDSDVPLQVSNVVVPHLLVKAAAKLLLALLLVLLPLLRSAAGGGLQAEHVSAPCLLGPPHRGSHVVVRGVGGSPL